MWLQDFVFDCAKKCWCVCVCEYTNFMHEHVWVQKNVCNVRAGVLPIVEDSGAIFLRSSHSNSFLVKFSEIPANLNSSPFDVLTVISFCCWLRIAVLIFSNLCSLSRYFSFSRSNFCFSRCSECNSFSNQAIPDSWLVVGLKKEIRLKFFSPISCVKHDKIDRDCKIVKKK